MTYWKDGTLCEYCCPVVEKIKVRLSSDQMISNGDKEDSIAHHCAPAALIASANSGCHLCSIICGEAASFPNGQLMQKVEAKSRSKGSYSPWIKIKKPNSRRLPIGRAGGPPEAVLELLSDLAPTNSIYVVPLQLNSTFNIGNRQAQSDDVTPRPWPFLSVPCISTGDEKALQLASDWLDVCRKEHKDCQRTLLAQRAVGPARLVDVSTVYEGVRVVEFSEHDEIPEYFALSYCWGKAECIRTTSKTVDEMRQGVPLDSLPRTLRDAVITTRRLGCKYIWIDSLCIIQDSTEDWKREAAKMGDVYQGATLTLGALHASGSGEGMFKERNPLCYRRLVIPGTDFEISNTANWVIWEFDGETAPLNTRAWVVQERLLARRTLFFGATGLFWECAERQTPESEVHPNAELFYHPGTNLTKLMSDILHGSATVHDFARFWSALRKLYTGCYLTRASDRSIAYLGLANVLTHATGFKTFCGIQMRIYPVDLCWKIPRTDSVVRDPESTEPSWSWLSVQSAVKPIQVESIVWLGEYSVMWSRSPIFVAKIEQVVEPADGTDAVEDREKLDIIGDSLNLQRAISLCPARSLCFLTWFIPVYLLQDNRLTLKMPKEIRPGVDTTTPASVATPRASSAPAMETSGIEDKSANSVEDHAYRWYPDGLVDPGIKEATFIYLARFANWDPNWEIEAGIIAIEKDRRIFQRLGVFKKSVFKHESMCKVYTGEGFDPYLLPNPFTGLEEMKRFVVLV